MGALRDECLNAEWLPTLDEARRKLALWREHYNQQRPHSALDDPTACSLCGSSKPTAKALRPFWPE